MTNPNKALWEKGDFTRIAMAMRTSGEEFVRALGIRPGERVLDLACGDGTTAIPAARLGAEVLGVDIASNLVAAGNRRAQELGLANIRFQEGDACDLQGIESDRYDWVVSVFGAMFAPKPFEVAREMVRVARPGGRIVMGNWIPNDPTLVAQVLKISAAYTPPPPEGFVSPMSWGLEANVIERFGAAGVPDANIAFARETFMMRADKPPAALVDDFRHWYGPTMNAFAAAEAAGRDAELLRDLSTLYTSLNQAGDPALTRLPATFLKVTVTKPALLSPSRSPAAAG